MAELTIDQIFAAIAHRLHVSAGQARRKFQLSFFTFNIEFLPATANQYTTGSFVVQNDSAFVICQTHYVAFKTDNVTPIDIALAASPQGTIAAFPGFTPFLVNLVDSGSGRQFSNIDTPIDNWFGTAQRPMRWPAPQVLDPNSTFSMRVQNLAAATNYNVRAAFVGYKVFGDVKDFRERKHV